MKNKINPKKVVLDAEELLLEQAFEAGDFVESDSFEKTKFDLEESAKEYIQLQTKKPVTIRVNQLDLIKLKARAKKLEIPYQTLLSTLIRQYVDGNKNLQL